MADLPRRLVAGNWKMNGVGDALDEARQVAEALRGAADGPRVAICPPATLIHRMALALEGSAVQVGAQDCHMEAAGAYTGDLGAGMLHDAGARLVILGHSERRSAYREDDALIAAKVEAALRAGLEPIVCVGETLEQRRSGRHLQIVQGQLAGSIPGSLSDRPFAVAYEPVWAIGSGLTPSLAEIAETHAAIRRVLVDRFGDHGATTPILYGGSVKAANAGEIMAVADVGGALVGGASLAASDFLPIIRAA